MPPSHPSNQVVIVVPGTLGTEFHDDAGNVWPGDLNDWLFGFKKLNRLLATDLQVGEIIREIGFVGIYKHLIKPIEDCGYSQSHSPPTLYTCPYDWRYPLQTTSVALAAKVAQARSDHGEKVKIVLVGHSLGGLMCRYYLESGEFDQAIGFENVSQLLLMGVPNLGLPQMISLVRGEEDHQFLDAQDVQTLSNQPGFSALYLMLPAPSAQKVWQTGGPIPWTSFDVLDPTNASNLGLSSAPNLDDAIDFRTKLDAGNRPAHVRYFSFVGSKQTTFSGAIVTNPGTPPFPLRKIEPPSGGDGMVPLWSAWLSDEQGLAVGGEHGTIFKDSQLRWGLSTLLGCTPAQALTVGGSGLQLDVDDLVLNQNGTTEISLRFDQPVERLATRIVVLRGNPEDEESIESLTPVASIPLEYSGVPIRSLRLEWKIELEPGAYRLEFQGESERSGVATADFFVASRTQRKGV